ncbi:hypothetical protein [Cupriavidus sp. CuC1]|uniref:hypothetical protein n=1 Tax=Cupriavidus sp. CuC1 TaxID=3373131 RepID=UPI0037CF2716
MIKTAIASLFLAGAATCALAQGAESPVRIVFNDGVNTYIQAHPGVALTVPDAVRRQDAFLVRGMPVEIIAYANGRRYEIRRTGNSSQAYVVDLVTPREVVAPPAAVTAAAPVAAPTPAPTVAPAPVQAKADRAPPIAPPVTAAADADDARLAVPGTSDDEIRAAIAEAKAKGWTSISAAGDPEFIVRVHALWNEVSPASPVASK